MPLEPELGTPAAWLTRARSNLIRAQQPKPEGVLWEDLCFDAQQAAEKALKRSGIELPEEIRLAAALSAYAVGTRYPGPMEPVTEEDYRRAVSLAETVVRWVEHQIQNEASGRSE